MASYTYRIDRFIGLDQSRDENLISPCFSPDAMNMDASDGYLAVTRGFSKLLPAPVPTEGLIIRRIAIFRNASKEIPVAVTKNGIFTYDAENESWSMGYQYPASNYKRRISTLMTRIGTTDYMLIADGVGQMRKFDGTNFTAFGSSAGNSNIAAGCIAMFRGRLFAAGDRQNPNRLYYSKLPGGTRTIEDWGPDADSPAVEGGHVEIGSAGGDPITNICAMSNQLLIFKNGSVYRLIGDRPSNFTIELVKADSTPVSFAGAAVWRDVIYYVTRGGLHCFNGVSAAPMPDARMIKRIMDGADTSDSRMAIAGDRLFFTVGVGNETRLIEYDLTQRRYMQYGGFRPYDILGDDGNLIIANSNKYLEKWGEGDSFDGAEIEAYWTTPLTDLADKSVIKGLRELYLRGSAEGASMLMIDTTAGPHRDTGRVLLPETPEEVLEVPLRNEGRTVRLRLYNEAGGHFRLEGGLELELSVRKRTE
ncbi:MAG: hypothetical protein K6G56_07435 [Clostridiales bacterium]|nr:hypothetical protein [Clostridiales bacterium]